MPWLTMPHVATQFPSEPTSAVGERTISRTSSSEIDITRMRVAIDRQPALPCRVDTLQCFSRFTPVVGSGAFQMDDLDVDAARLGDVDGFIHRFEQLVRFIANVGEVTGAVALQNAAQRDH